MVTGAKGQSYNMPTCTLFAFEAVVPDTMILPLLQQMMLPTPSSLPTAASMVHNSVQLEGEINQELTFLKNTLNKNAESFSHLSIPVQFITQMAALAQYNEQRLFS